MADDDDGRIARNLFRTASDSSSSRSSDEPEEEKNESSVTRRSGSTAAARRNTAAAEAEADEEEDDETSNVTSSRNLYVQHRIGNLVLETQGAGGGSIAQRLWPAAQHLVDFVLEIMMSTTTTNDDADGQQEQQRTTNVSPDDDEGTEQEHVQSRLVNKQQCEPLSSASTLCHHEADDVACGVSISTSTTKKTGGGDTIATTTTTTTTRTTMQKTQSAIHARTQLQQILWHQERLFLVELGAGIGLTGLALATTATPSTRRRAQVHLLLTDLDEAMTLLQRNIESNRSKLFQSSSTTSFNDDNDEDDNIATTTTTRTAQAQPLQWGVVEDYEKAMAWYRRVASMPPQYKSPESLSSLCNDQHNNALAPPAPAAPPILFLGSDLVYWECLYEPLEHALFHLLLKAPIGSLCLLAGMRRWKRDTAFYKALGKRKWKQTSSSSSATIWQLQCTCIQEDITTISIENSAKDGSESSHHDQQHRRREILRIYAVELVRRR